MQLRFFKLEEFKCPCGRKECDAPAMDMTTLLKLDGLRLELGESMQVTSGARCSFWNKRVGGADQSQHLLGRAVDISCPDGVYMRRLLLLAMKHGFSVGVKKHLIHLDTRPGVPVVFGY